MNCWNEVFEKDKGMGTMVQWKKLASIRGLAQLLHSIAASTVIFVVVVSSIQSLNS